MLKRALLCSITCYSFLVSKNNIARESCKTVFISPPPLPLLLFQWPEESEKKERYVAFYFHHCPKTPMSAEKTAIENKGELCS
jgi:hypothetical protein